MIRLTDVVKEYPNGAHALNGLTMEIQDGEFVFMVGPSGSGKSTVIKLLIGEIEPSEGKVMVNGFSLRNIREWQIPYMRRTVGVIFQDFRLIDTKSVYDNMVFAMRAVGAGPKEIRKRIPYCLNLVGLENKSRRLPSELSGGEQQRVAIARALATDPKVLLCDEATSALDPSTTQSILELLRELNQTLGVTMVVITHQMNVIEAICHRVAILDGGVVAEEGNVADIFANPRSAIGRQFVYPDGVKLDQLAASKVIRVVFNGGSSYEPLIASLAMDCRVKVNILGADTRNIDGKAFGSMLLGLPENRQEADRALQYLRAQPDITIEEVPHYA